MRDLCARRGHGAHGGRAGEGLKGIWNAGEHLLLASFIFPLCVKLVLQKRKRHTLTDDDRERLFAIDYLLAEQMLGSPEPGIKPYGWNEGRHKASVRRALERAIKVLGAHEAAKASPPTD